MVVAAPAKRQSSNGLVESHWKIMDHMARAYLTERQMPRAFWFYAIVHSARKMNAIPGKIHGHISSPFLLIHGVGHDERTWIPLFSICYFHHKKDGNLKRSKHQPIRWMALSSVVHLLPTLFWSTIHATNNNTSQIAIASTRTTSLVPSIETLNMTVVFSALFTAMTILPSRNYILLVLESNALTLLLTCFWPIQSWT